MRLQCQDVLNLFDPVSISKAYQRALQLEKQMARKGSSGMAKWDAGASSNTSRGSMNLPVNAPKLVGPPQAGRTQISGPRCFNCGEPGYRQVDCKKGPCKGPFIETEESSVDHNGDVNTYSKLVFDEDDSTTEEYLEGDTGTLLVVCRSCLAPCSVDDDWQRANIF